VRGYILRREHKGDKLEIKIENHSSSNLNQPQDVIGGDYDYTSGIVGTLIYEGEGNGVDIIQKAKKIIGDFYNPQQT